MKQLLTSMAACFPDRFNRKAWQDLLPEYVEEQIRLHQQKLKTYTLENQAWQDSDHQTPEPVLPMPPDELGLACGLYAKSLGLNFQAMAYCMFVAQERAQHFQQVSEWVRTERDHYKQICEFAGIEG